MTSELSYDPTVRRDTPLAQKLKRRIRDQGPITVCEYMTACLYDSEHGYYRTKPAIGASSDFITAPEISQVFGEIIGLWSVVTWQQMGCPQQFNLIELGPGRATLMCDALRAAQIVPEFGTAASVHLIECNRALIEIQRERLETSAITAQWHDAMFQVSKTDQAEFATDLSIPPVATIVIANEFIDAAPVEQFQKTQNGWFERTVNLDETDQLVFGTSKHRARGLSNLTANLQDAPDGTIVERLGAIGDITMPLVEIAKQAPVAALIIDYGHTQSAAGDTLQAVRAHKQEHPLCSPGDADLSTQVDFAQLTKRFKDTGLAVDGPATQGDVLGQLGIVERASKLMAANPQRAGEIEAGVARLMSPGGMGGRFHVLGVRSKGMAQLAGL